MADMAVAKIMGMDGGGFADAVTAYRVYPGNPAVDPDHQMKRFVGHAAIRSGVTAESPFRAAAAFCKMLCPKPLLPAAPVYGGYYAAPYYVRGRYVAPRRWYRAGYYW